MVYGFIYTKENSQFLEGVDCKVFDNLISIEVFITLARPHKTVIIYKKSYTQLKRHHFSLRDLKMFYHIQNPGLRYPFFHIYI